MLVHVVVLSTGGVMVWADDLLADALAYVAQDETGVVRSGPHATRVIGAGAPDPTP